MNFSNDIPIIEKYNSRRRANAKTRIQLHMPPSPYDGDPFVADVVMLMNNPGWSETSIPEDHTLKVPGWPIAGMSPEARPEFRSWYNRPFKQLIERFGAQTVANRVAIVQICPWASAAFDINLVLPSRAWQVSVAKQARDRGAIIVIGRSVKFWQQELGAAPNIFVARPPINPAISEKSIGAQAYALVTDRLKESVA